jgi:hypothetical protein
MVAIIITVVEIEVIQSVMAVCLNFAHIFGYGVGVFLLWAQLSLLLDMFVLLSMLLEGGIKFVC